MQSKPKTSKKGVTLDLHVKEPKRKKDKFSLINSQDRVLFYIPYRYFIDQNKSTLILKNGGFMRVFKIVNKDLNFVDNFQFLIDSLNISKFCIFNISLALLSMPIFSIFVALIIYSKPL